MKNISLFAIASLISFFAAAQKLRPEQVPTAVKLAFKNAFPKIKEVKWSKESAEEIEAEFKSGEHKISATYSNAGVRTSTETELKKSELPKLIKVTIAKQFAGYEIKEAAKLEAPATPLTYEAELEKGKVKWEVKFSQGGDVLKKEETSKEANKKN